ncbi:MAG: class I SAM-dependent methyltransferase [Vicingus serpentipes]|nr:class I SAM-dependent methyltransferase [Vicingus serpentipes]
MTNQEFIQQHKNKTSSEVALLLSKKSELDKEFIINQINGIQKAKKKLPELYNNPDFIYPSALSMEQCSSEQTAIYKSTLVKGKSLIDLTGGLGIDSYYFSKQIDDITYLEQNTKLFETANTNFKLLGATNIKTINTTCENFLKTNTTQYDVAYIDPSRRNETQRVFFLNECMPNIIELSDDIFKITHQILVKTAPLLDIKQSIKDLKYVSKVFVIAVNNECKEVLYLLDKGTSKTIKIETINLGSPPQHFSFRLTDEIMNTPTFSEPQTYLYEPNVAILKAGAFNTIATSLNIQKLAPNSHLYTSKEMIPDFPGRIFHIQQVLNYNLKEFKPLNIKQANITCRNFNEKPESVKKKLKLKDGGNTYLFATTNQHNKPILVCCSKIK